MQRFLLTHETVVPALLVAVLVAWAASGPLGRAMGARRLAAAALVLACLGPLALTLGPQLPLELGSGRGCVSHVRPYRWWGQGGEEVANLLLLVPLGLLAPLLLRARAAVPLLVLGAGFPWAVELTQYLLPWLGRECDLTDVALNGLGLAAGTAAGVLLVLVRRLRRRRTAPGPRRSVSPGT
ncbi:VanZ family protein [Aquipuribacter hungaricus]|uniref:VanZ family protein n=1 Tax=Aquipuribacter hungaricus TaxID=545624 RepID=A0ABV7WAS0_9MICO